MMGELMWLPASAGRLRAASDVGLMSEALAAAARRASASIISRIEK
jgi:hypothetical protein